MIRRDAVQNVARATLQVLVVEDTPGDWELVRNRLEALGCDVLHATTTDDALVLAETVRPGLILADLRLDGGVEDGLSLLAQLRENPTTSAIPVFVHSVLVDKAREALGALGRANGYLPKPCSFQELKRVIDECAGGRLWVLDGDSPPVEASIGTQPAPMPDFFEHLVRNLPCGIAFCDRELVVRWANPNLANLLGRPVDSLIGASLAEAFGEERQALASMLRGVLFTGKPYSTFSLPFVVAGPDGTRETFWDITCRLAQGRDGEVTGILVRCFDATERAQQPATSEPRAGTADLERLKEEFLASVTHGLRTPLNVITGFASLLEEDIAGLLGDEQRSYVRKILGASDWMLALVNDLLDQAKIEAGHFEVLPVPAAIAPIVEQTLELLAPLARAKQLELQTALPPGLKVLIDERRMAQVLIKLVKNAIEWSPARGRVTVRATLEDGCVRCEVADEGPGIVPEAQARLFERFHEATFALDHRMVGTGLGLSICRGIVEAHGGVIGVQSAGPGQGSTFWFTLSQAAPR